MQIIARYKILEISNIRKVYGRNGRISYYIFDISVEDRYDDNNVILITRIAYSWWELRKIKKLKYIHLVEDKEMNENETN